MDKISAARIQLGAFFKNKRIEMGRSIEDLAKHLNVSFEIIEKIEKGSFSWDIDLHHSICAALEIKPYFHSSESPFKNEYHPQSLDEEDPNRYHGFYLSDNELLYPGQLAIIKLTSPRLFLRFNYSESFFIDFDDWMLNHTTMEWLDPSDKPGTEEEIEEVLIDCWNFLSLSENNY